MKRTLSALALVALSASALAFDANTATTDELISVRGIGPVIAARIEQARPFAGCADMESRVKGFGPRKRETLEAGGHTCGAAKHNADD